MINLKMYNGKWQMHIGDEVWQFNEVKEFILILEQIIGIKEKYGKEVK
jgi:hypothetical protein